MREMSAVSCVVLQLLQGHEALLPKLWWEFFGLGSRAVWWAELGGCRRDPACCDRWTSEMGKGGENMTRARYSLPL